jgi:hypothetical protein
MFLGARTTRREFALSIKKSDQKQPVSTRKATANAQNAKRSTGPRTAAGKATTRTNALRSGLWAMLPEPIGQGDLAEDPLAIELFISETALAFRPRDNVEEMQATRIATCYLKMRRANSMEARVLSGPLMTDEGKSVDATRPFVERDRGGLEQLVEWQTGVRAVVDVNFAAIYIMLRTHLAVCDGVRVSVPESDPSAPADSSWAQAEVQRIIDTHIGETILVWAFEQLHNLSNCMDRIAALRADHTRQRLSDYEGVTRIDQRIGRELQRAIAEYQKLQKRNLDAD